MTSEAAAEARIMWKVSLRLLPFLFLLYVVNILDRVNIGFARLQMLPDLGMTEQQYAFGAGLFYVGYILFEVPSNLILRRTGARVWIARILVSWGLVSSAMMFVTGPWGYSLLRVLLGVAEAGFFPGVILYLSYWFPARERAKAVALFMIAGSVAGVVGYPASGAVLQYMNGTGGLAGWQWMFLLEGIPAVLLGAVALFYLTDSPARAGWLTLPERTWLAERMEGEESAHRAARPHSMASGGRSAASGCSSPSILQCCWRTTPSAFTGRNSLKTALRDGPRRKLVCWRRSPARPASSVWWCSASIRIAPANAAGTSPWPPSLHLRPAVGSWVALALSPAFIVLGLALASLGMKSMLPTF